MSSRLDTIALTIANCRFIFNADAEFAVVTTREQLGPWNAFVMRTADGYRTPFLYASGLTAETAVCELHAKSADAARSHIEHHGFGLDQALKKKDQSKPSSSQSNSEALSDSTLTGVDVIDLSASSDCESLSDDETVSVASGAGGGKGHKQNGNRKSHHKRTKEQGGKDSSNARLPRSRSRSRSTTRSSASRSRSRSRSSSTTSEYRQIYVPLPRLQPMNSMRPVSMRPLNAAPPPPPPQPSSGYITNWPPHMREMPSQPRLQGMNGWNQGGQHSHHHHPAQQQNPSPPPSGPTAPTPPNNNPQGQGQPQVLHDVLLRIHWTGRGYAQVLKRLTPTQGTLKSVALSYVRTSPSAFTGVLPGDHQAVKIPVGSQGSVHLFASLRSVLVAGEQIDLHTYHGENLGRLLVAPEYATAITGRGGGLPRFEIEVNCVPPPVGFGGAGGSQGKAGGGAGRGMMGLGQGQGQGLGQGQVVGEC